MTTFIIKNVRDHDILVGTVPLTKGQQLTAHELTNAINDAADRGDITVTNAEETPAELKQIGDAIMEGVNEMKKTAES